jgi:hypothetical protein
MGRWNMSQAANCTLCLENAQLSLRQLTCGLLLILASGCGQGGPEVAPVKGRVTLDGQPLKMVDIVFQPTNGDPPSTSRTDDNGNYEMLYKRGVMGARTGEHSVRIDFTSGIVSNPPKIPPRYNTQSELKEEVKSGQNEFNFELKSQPN